MRKSSMLRMLPILAMAGMMNNPTTVGLGNENQDPSQRKYGAWGWSGFTGSGTNDNRKRKHNRLHMKHLLKLKHRRRNNN